MRAPSIIVLISIFLLGFTACKTKQKSAFKPVDYKEDLSVVRPKFEPAKEVEEKEEIEITGHINDELNAIIDSMATENRKLEFIKGYRIAIYNGTSREEMNQLKSKFYSLFPEYDIYMVYQQPAFKLQAGDFTERFEAQKALMRIKAEIPSALIVEEQVKIRRR